MPAIPVPAGMGGLLVWLETCYNLAFFAYLCCLYDNDSFIQVKCQKYMYVSVEWQLVAYFTLSS